MINFLISFDKSLTEKQFNEQRINDVLVQLPDSAQVCNYNNKNWIVWIGDYILPEDYPDLKSFLEKQAKNFSLSDLLKVGGNYYCIFFQSETNQVNIYTSFLNIMPLYYSNEINRVYVSSSQKPIVDASRQEYGLNNEFILEKLLFNYPFRNNTIYSGIKMVSGNHYLAIDQSGAQEYAHTDILDLVQENPLPIKKVRDHLTNFLNSRIDAYLPEEEFYLSFTGGFDGRTILSRTLSTKKDLIGYSFGTKHSPDITIPKNQSEKLHIKFHPFYLDNKIYYENSLKYGLELVDITSSMSNFSRAHYVYAVSEISKTHKYIVTGNFGSELFRAFHNTGVMVSPFMYGLFNASNIDEFLETYSYPELSMLNKDAIDKNLIDLKESISNSGVFHRQGFTKNQVFYKYVFEDIFRKYFGAELMMQNQYLINRTPFIDYQLIVELLKTQLAGVYSNFYEQNPVNRLKGQLLYANTIRINSPELYNLKTGKGYTPKDVISAIGKFKLVANSINKKLKKNIQTDDFAVRKSFQNNLDYFKQMNIYESIFSPAKLKQLHSEDIKDLNNTINILSLNWYINKNFK